MTGVESENEDYQRMEHENWWLSFLSRIYYKNWLPIGPTGVQARRSGPSATGVISRGMKWC